MIFATIDRWCNGPQATFGNLTTHFGFSCRTVERPWQDNEPYVSCIPADVYPIRRDTFKGKYDDLAIDGVPKRWAIEMHRANAASQLQGCIAPGMYLGVYKGQWAVLDSTLALEKILDEFDRFVGEVSAEPFLSIRWRVSPEKVCQA